MVDRNALPNIVVPTPERIEQWHKDHEFFWLSPDRKSYSGKDHGEMLVQHKDLFGFTQAQVDYATDRTVVSPEEMRDRSIHLAELAIERGWICILVNKIARAVPAMPQVVFWFYAETEDVYDRITAWLKGRGITQGKVRLRTIMMRSWDAPVQSLFAKAQFSKKGNKATCPVCGTEIGNEELYMRGVCARCGTKLW